MTSVVAIPLYFTIYILQTRQWQHTLLISVATLIATETKQYISLIPVVQAFNPSHSEYYKIGGDSSQTHS